MGEIYRGPDVSPDCANCPCSKDGAPVKPIRGAGSVKRLAIVGEGPSTEEMYQGWPFVGPSGKLLQQVLDAGGIDRHSIWITNALLCQRPYSPEKLERAIECCRPRLQQELSLVAPTAVCALGASAAQALQLPVTAITDARGTLQQSPLLSVTVPVITALHPAAILRGGAGDMKGAGTQKMNVDAQYVFLEADVHKAYALATGIGVERFGRWSDDIRLIAGTPEYALTEYAAVGTLIADAYDKHILGIDLEWGKDGAITWLGLATTRNAISLYWPRVQGAFISRLREVGADASLPKLFHNLQADIPVWEAQIGKINGIAEDTMLMHHAAFPGAAHDLQNVASQFLMISPWKALRGAEEKQAKKDATKLEREARKAQKKLEHEARNAATSDAAKARKRARVAAHEARNEASRQTTLDILKLLE